MRDLALETITVLQRIKNAILQGPPGTGKSFVIGEIAERWEELTGRPLEGRGNGNYAITLHPNSTYEDFVEGLVYSDEKGHFVRRDGFFKRITQAALEAPNQDFLVLIDEINRANIPKVLGDLLLTIEGSKRSRWTGTHWDSPVSVTLPYSAESFSIPENVYIVGTMNSTDRSIAPIDSALRRRFGFVQVDPLPSNEIVRRVAVHEGDHAAELVKRSADHLGLLNSVLRQCVGPESLIGHSYLFGVKEFDLTDPLMFDPLSPVRNAVTAETPKAIWLEAASLDGGSGNQLGIPDRNEPRGIRGLVDQFYPMASTADGEQRRTSLINDVADRGTVDIMFDGKRYLNNTLRWNSGGPNYKLYYSGKTTGNEAFSKAAAKNRLAKKIHVWVQNIDLSYELLLLERSQRVLDALKAVSVEPGWWERTQPSTSGRSYGLINLTSLKETAPQFQTPREEAEYSIWRYQILPQLVETLSHAGAAELLDPKTRLDWLDSAELISLSREWEAIDSFLADLGLALEFQGTGLMRSIAIVDMNLLPTAADLSSTELLATKGYEPQHP